MKVAIVSDFHIGYERFYEDAAAQARYALFKAADLADAIIIPGDIFDRRAPAPDVIAQAVNIFRDLREAMGKSAARVREFRPVDPAIKCYTDIPVIAIPGTHERTAAGRENALQLLGLAGLLVDTSEATTIIEMGSDRVAVFGIGGISEERFKEKLKELDPKPVAGAYNIFMMHQSTYELLPFSEEFIRNDELPVGFDLYVNGHIHSKVVSEVHGKKFLIPGSTVLTQLKEGEQGRKGFILFDTATDKYEFVEIDSRPFFVIKLEQDLSNSAAIREKCEKEIEKIILASSTKPIIRLILKGVLPHGISVSDLHIGILQKTYSDRAYLEVDMSNLVDESAEKNAQNLRDEKIDDIPIKQLGIDLLLSKLRENGFEKSISITELFGVLGGELPKEKAVKKAMELLFEKETV
jgi:DNA repair exonuclease SbcCD nuclease subunit